MADHAVSTSTLRFLAVSRAFVRTWGRLYHGVTVRGGNNVPRTGGVIVASNHQSHLDPALLCACGPRPVHFLAKEELFKVPGLGLLLKWMGMVPTPRDGAAMAAMRAGIRILKENHVLGIFPEGTRSKTGERLPAEPGVVALAVMAGNVPIVPAYIDGSWAAMPPGAGFPRFRKPITITFGEPIILTPAECNLKDKAKLTETAELIMDRIFALRGSSTTTPATPAGSRA
ncbi:MAG TPA: lysophospholipid acyltransferase family protein [bacterium]|nr:lysophospholipid acyltransferase family protein [bacterium]